MACLVVKEFFTTDYRGIEQILKDSSDLRNILELSEIPHYTTFQKAAQRLTSKKTLDKLIKEILTMAIEGKIMKKNVALSSIDGTGFESHHISAYFVKRKAKGQEIYQMTTYTTYPKAGIISDCDTHLVIAGIPERGPYPDIVHFKKAIIEAEKNIHLKALTADAGYDSEASHVFAREAGTADRFPAERLTDRGRNPATDRRERRRSRYSADRMPQRQLGRRSQRQLVRCGSRLFTVKQAPKLHRSFGAIHLYKNQKWLFNL